MLQVVINQSANEQRNQNSDSTPAADHSTAEEKGGPTEERRQASVGDVELGYLGGGVGSGEEGEDLRESGLGTADTGRGRRSSSARLLG
jgi:hypothetical protein